MSSTKFIVYTLNGMCCHTLHTLGGVEILIFFADWHKKTHAIVGEKCTVKIRERRHNTVIYIIFFVLIFCLVLYLPRNV